MNRTDLTYQPEVSNSLSIWSTSGLIHERVTTGDPETWRARLPAAPAGPLFFRLTVTSP